MKNGFSIFVTVITVLLIALFQPVFAQENERPGEDSITGRLKIDSQYVEHLVLVDDRGRRKEFENPAETLDLPPGKYRLQEVKLTGGYQSYAWNNQDLEWVTVSSEEPADLKFGPPLSQFLVVTRQRSILKFDYKLIGRAGEYYSLSERKNAPEFAVYKGDKKITSGKFEYGTDGLYSYSWRVPFTTNGQLGLIASADLGQLGSSGSNPVLYDWNFLYGLRDLLPGTILWLILILTIILVKENRTTKALLILISLLVARLLCLALKVLLQIPSSQVYLFNLSCACFIVCISVLMLLAHKRIGCNRFATFLWAVVLSVIIGAATYISSSGLEFNREMMVLMVLYVVGILAVLTGLVLAAHCCRDYYSPIRFTLFLAVCTPAGAILVMLIYASIALGIMVVGGSLPSGWYQIFTQILVFGFIFGGILYAVELPFIILALNCPFFRKPFHDYFRLRGMDFTLKTAPAPEHIMLTKAADKSADSEDKVANRWMDPPRPKD